MRMFMYVNHKKFKDFSAVSAYSFPHLSLDEYIKQRNTLLIKRYTSRGFVKISCHIIVCSLGNFTMLNLFLCKKVNDPS